MTRAPRRTPEQMAADALAATSKRLGALDKRIDRLTDERARAVDERIQLRNLRDYQAAHPLLTKEEEE